jgi:hypothetical protein
MFQKNTYSVGIRMGRRAVEILHFSPRGEFLGGVYVPLESVETEEERFEEWEQWEKEVYTVSLKTGLERLGIRRGSAVKAVFSVPQNAILSHFFRIGEKEKNIVSDEDALWRLAEREARSMIPADLATLAAHVCLASGEENPLIFDAALRAVPRTIAEYYASALEEAGIEPEAAEGEDIAIARSLRGRTSSDTALILHADEEKGFLAILTPRDIPVLSVLVFYPSHGPSADIVGAWDREASQALRFYQESFQGKIGTCFVSGRLAAVPGMLENFSLRFEGIGVAARPSFEHLIKKEGGESLFLPSAAAVGVAIRAASGGKGENFLSRARMNLMVKSL